MAIAAGDTRTVIVGVGGGVAAYKACHVVRLFARQGWHVTVVPTANACRFVGAATFEALSHNPVATDVFSGVDKVRHVALGQGADLIVIAPATADLIARLACGLADDMLTATCLVASCPIVIAPAMHTEMWLHPATQENVATLRRRGVTVLDPASGRLTGADVGPGRLLEPEQIVELAGVVFGDAPLVRRLEGRHVVITAGGTREFIDPVRFVGNFSSGKQGFALAELAGQMGASVTLIAASCDRLPTPAATNIVRVTTARQMAVAVKDCLADETTDALVMAAAVADMRPAHQAQAKLKKSEAADKLAQVEMTENPDILAEVCHDISRPPVVVGFAAETVDGNKVSAAVRLEKLGRAKMARKGCDLLLVNDVSGDKVFGRDRNRGILLGSREECVPVADGTKYEVARVLCEAIADRLAEN